MPDFVNQAVNFFDSALNWLMALAVPGTALAVGYHALMKSTAQDEMSAVTHARGMKNALLYGALTLGAGGITKAVLQFFK